jgi:hypothetical protein
MCFIRCSLAPAILALFGAALAKMRIERRGMHRVPGHFSSVTGAADAASDHAAVVAEFNV